MRLRFSVLLLPAILVLYWAEKVESQTDEVTMTSQFRQEILAALQAITVSVNSLSERVVSTERLAKELQQGMSSMQSEITSKIGQCNSQIGQISLGVAGISSKLEQQEVRVGNKLRDLTVQINGWREIQTAQARETTTTVGRYGSEASQLSAQVSSFSNRLGQCETQLRNVSAAVTGISSQLVLHELMAGNIMRDLQAQLNETIKAQTTTPTTTTTTTTPSPVAFVPRYNYQPIIRACGGVFQIRLGTPVEIQYKLGQNYDNYEFCVWSFVPDSHATSYEFRLLQGTFEANYDGILFYSWNGEGVIDVIRQSDTSHTVNGNYAFLQFYSDGSTTHEGFSLRVTARSSGSPSTSFPYSAVSLTGSSGGYTLPNPTDQGRSEYVINERISALLPVAKKPDGSFKERTARVSWLNTESNYDFLYIFPLKLFRDTATETITLAGLSGNHSSEVNSTVTNKAILYLFKSDGSNNGKGFRLAWS